MTTPSMPAQALNKTQDKVFRLLRMLGPNEWLFGWHLGKRERTAVRQLIQLGLAEQAPSAPAGHINPDKYRLKRSE